jgi:hypothetical protein
VGELDLAGISLPAIVCRRVGLTPPHVFLDDAFIRLR